MNIHQINVNEAGKADLETLKGIGPNRAEAIIRQRKEQGPFKSIEDLQQRLEIEDEEFQQLKNILKI
jgi:competence protein ComEA